MQAEILAPSPSERVVRRRTRRDPKPRFKADISHQLDAVNGCPAVQVPKDHLTRAVREVVQALDMCELEKTYSSLGRHGYRPSDILAVWIYASLIGLHESTKVARALKTDAAFRFLSGGHAVSGATLRRFRQRNGDFFAEAIEQTVMLAQQRKMLEPTQLAVDSVRLRAHASFKATRTLRRSKKRLQELGLVDISVLSEEARAKYEASVTKHQAVVERCEQEGRSTWVTTNDSAGMMKFPGGAHAPGHRVTITAAGVKARLVISVLVDADGNDYGKLGPVLERARKTLLRGGVPPTARLQVAADPGYFCEEDLAFSNENAEWVDVLIPEAPEGGHTDSGKRFFDYHQFQISEDLIATCPAGRTMKGPYSDAREGTRWNGRDCGTCSLRPRCTSGNQRTLTIRLAMDNLRRQMRTRMAQPGARQRYNQRIATVEPVFSNIEHVMGFRRLSSRVEPTILAEILLKLLAHNLSRLIAARLLRRVLLLLKHISINPVSAIETRRSFMIVSNGEVLRLERHGGDTPREGDAARRRGQRCTASCA